jgi:hypothetical protein
MATLSFNQTVNAEQIKSLKNARIKNDYNKNLLHKRQDQIKREARELRRFASLKAGAVANYCFELADLLESKL